LIREEIAAMVQASKKKKINPQKKVDKKQERQQEQQPNAANPQLQNGITHDKEAPTKIVIDKENDKATNQENQDILAPIKKAKSKLNSAEYRLKKNIGKKETSEQNRKEAEQEIQQLESRLKNLGNGVKLKI